MADRNLGNDVNVTNEQTEQCSEKNGYIGRKLTHLMTTIGASALLVACGSANAEDKAEKVELTSMPVAEQPVVKEASNKALIIGLTPEILKNIPKEARQFIDPKTGEFDVSACMKAGINPNDCFSWDGEHGIAVAKFIKDKNYAEANEAIKRMTESLNN